MPARETWTSWEGGPCELHEVQQRQMSRRAPGSVESPVSVQTRMSLRVALQSRTWGYWGMKSWTRANNMHSQTRKLTNTCWLLIMLPIITSPHCYLKKCRNCLPESWGITFFHCNPMSCLIGIFKSVSIKHPANARRAVEYKRLFSVQDRGPLPFCCPPNILHQAFCFKVQLLQKILRSFPWY